MISSGQHVRSRGGSTVKDEGLRPSHIDAYHDPVTKTYLQLYSAYQEACDRAGLVDFAEILLRTHELLRDKSTFANITKHALSISWLTNSKIPTTSNTLGFE